MNRLMIMTAVVAMVLTACGGGSKIEGNVTISSNSL